MTNVKLKLMFYLLNALLTADIVHSRPYSSHNDSQAYGNTNTQYNGNANSKPYSNSQPYSGNTDSQPFSNTQTYTGNTNSQFSGYSNGNSQYSGSLSQLHSETGEQYPENAHIQDTNPKLNADNTTDIIIKFPSNNTFNLPVESNSDTLVVAHDEDETAEETNISSNSNMEAIVNAEQDRDEGISVNRKRPKPQEPKDKQLNTSTSLLEDIIDSETDREESITDILFKPESEFVDIPRFEFLIAAKVSESENSMRNDSDLKNSSDVMKKMDYVELVEVGKAVGGNSSAYMLNITGHEVEDDVAPDTRFTDVQTWFLACFGTMLPLLLLLAWIICIRSLWRRYLPGICPGMCITPGSSSIDSSEKPEANLQQLKSPIEDGSSMGADTPASNGSIFTMTLKNNHLIVETEERNDITRNGRETKMKYSPDNDGIFVVEVQQSTAYRPQKPPPSPPREAELAPNQAIVHRVSEEAHDSESSRFERDKALALSSTGLSISDLSMSSIGSHNVSYSYSSQLGYEQGPFGYPVYAGYDVNHDTHEGIITDYSQEPLICKTPADPYKPVVTAAIFKQDSIIGSDVLQGPGYCLEGSTDGPLLSDVQAREYSLHHLQEQKMMENGVAVPILEKIESENQSFNRADSLPVRLDEGKEELKEAMETIKEDDRPANMLNGKRAPLPIIRTEVYETVKDAILPPGSPKFEKLFNDSSPADSSFDSPPMITITEESESSKSETS